MKTKTFLGLTVGLAAIAAAAIVTVSSVNERSTQSDLLTKNLEALTQYEFGGQNWDNDHHWYNGVGNAWKPVIVDCTQSRSVGIDSTYISETFSGKMVECAGGDGNCWNGTSCQPS